jgi:hypothetical protein
MKISEARTCLRVNAANAGDSNQYEDDAIDSAIRTVGDDLARRTDATLTATAITLTEASDVVPLVHADFREERLRSALLDGSNVQVDVVVSNGGNIGGLVAGREGGWRSGQALKAELDLWSIEELSEKALAYRDVTGQPVAIAFETPVTARVFPTPDDDYSLRVRWVTPFTSWYSGVALATASVGGGAVTAVAKVSGGSGYTSTPAVTFSGGGGSGATATATVSRGRLVSVAVTGAGTLYTSAPTVLFDGQSGADATLNIPDDYLREALMHGAVAALQFSDLKRRFGSASWQRYEEFVSRLSVRAPRRGTLRRRY